MTSNAFDLEKQESVTARPLTNIQDKLGLFLTEDVVTDYNEVADSLSRQFMLKHLGMDQRCSGERNQHCGTVK